VLRLWADGLSNKQIAAECDVTEQTIKRHVSALLVCFNVPNRAALVHRAIQLGVITSVWLSMIEESLGGPR